MIKSYLSLGTCTLSCSVKKALNRAIFIEQENDYKSTRTAETLSRLIQYIACNLGNIIKSIKDVSSRAANT